MCVACALAGRVPAADADDPFASEGAAEALGQVLPPGTRIRWTGVAGLRLDVGGMAVAFDPFVSRPGLAAVLFARPRPDAAAVRARFADLDAVFVGHTHYDHAMDLAAVAEASPRARIHGSRTTVELCRRLGIAPDRLVTVEDGGRHVFGSLAVEAVAARHGIVPVIRHVDRKDLPRRGLPWTPFRYPMGDVFVWRVEAGGRTLFVQGSAGIEEGALARQAPVDLLLACLAARRGTPAYLERLGARLRPRVLSPLHHDDFFRPLDRPPRPVPGLDWPAFLADARALEAAHGTRLVGLPFDRPVEV